MRSLRVLLVGPLLLGCAANVPAGAGPTPRTGADTRAATDPAAAVAHAAATINAEDVYRHVAYLASDELRGRDTPSPGLELAAEYVAAQFRAFGLQPAGDSGTYIQRWPFQSATLDPARVTFRATGELGATTPSFGREYFILPGRDAVSAPLVWAGTAAPGRQPPGPEASGKVVAFYVPGTELNQAWNTTVAVAVQSAMAANAAAILLVLDPGFPAEMVAALSSQVGAQQGAPRTIVGLSYAAARAMLHNSLTDLDQLRTGDNRVVSIPRTTIELHAPQSAFEARPPNVVAIMPGSDPVLRDTYVVFSAHIDHDGVGAPDAKGDSIYNGADDDASGTAALIEVAQAFATLPVRPARSLIFVGVSGEEKGLLGSAHFARNPPVPVESMVANINIDMIGRNAPDTIVAIGQDYTSLGPLVQEVARAHPDLGLVVAPDLWPEEGLFLRSDHFNFARAGVPAIFFTSGLHEQYHQPSDEVELIDTDKLSRVARLIFYLGHAIATRADPPAWTEAGRAVMRSTGGP